MFINNCLGYKNHRYFLLFLLSYALYLLGVLAHSIIIIYLACSDKDTQIGYVTLNVAAQSVLVLIVFIHSPVLLLQLKSQTGKLCRINATEKEPELSASFNFDSNSMEKSGRWSSFKTNVQDVFKFQPQS